MKAPQETYEKREQYETSRRFTIAAGLAAAILVTGIFLFRTRFTHQPPPPAKAQAQTPFVAPIPQQSKAEQLPPYVFHTTKYKFSDAAMQTYQEDINRQGARMARAYARIRTEFTQACATPSITRTPAWQKAFGQDLTEFRMAGKLIGDCPAVPTRALAEDHEFAPVADLSAEIADHMERSIAHKNPNDASSIPYQVKQLFVVIRMAQGGIQRISEQEQAPTPDVLRADRPIIATPRADEAEKPRSNFAPKVHIGFRWPDENADQKQMDLYTNLSGLTLSLPSAGINPGR